MSETEAKPKKFTACPQCGAQVYCGMLNGEPRCWCFDMPRVMQVPEQKEAACLCKKCLEEAIGAQSER